MKQLTSLALCLVSLAAGIAAQKVDIKKTIAEWTPAALPQSPKETRAGSDARDMGLRGKVKQVSYQHESDDQGYPRQMLVREEFYGEDGNLIRMIEWDNVWPYRITVYGYIDGMRVSRSKTIDYGDGVNLGLQGGVPLTLEKTKDDGLPKDLRYDNRSIFKYDAKGRLIEEQYLANTGKLLTRTTFDYVPRENRRLRQHFDAAGKEWYRATEIYDPANGINGQEWLYDANKKVSSIRFMDHKYDEQGNWIMEKTREQLPLEKYRPKWIFTTHRTIEYYR